MKLKELEIDELPFTRMEERNNLSPTVIKIDKTQGMIFTDSTFLGSFSLSSIKGKVPSAHSSDPTSGP